MTLLHSASKGHLLFAFPYEQDLLLCIAITLPFKIQVRCWVICPIVSCSHSCLRSIIVHRYSTRLIPIFIPEGSQLSINWAGAKCWIWTNKRQLFIAGAFPIKLILHMGGLRIPHNHTSHLSWPVIHYLPSLHSFQLYTHPLLTIAFFKTLGLVVICSLPLLVNVAGLATYKVVLVSTGQFSSPAFTFRHTFI